MASPRSPTRPQQHRHRHRHRDAATELHRLTIHRRPSASLRTPPCPGGSKRLAFRRPAGVRDRSSHPLWAQRSPAQRWRSADCRRRPHLAGARAGCRAGCLRGSAGALHQSAAECRDCRPIDRWGQRDRQYPPYPAGAARQRPALPRVGNAPFSGDGSADHHLAHPLRPGDPPGRRGPANPPRGHEAHARRPRYHHRVRVRSTKLAVKFC